MRKHLVALGLVVAVGVLISFGCGGGTSSFQRASSPSTKGSVVVFGTDAPLCSVLAFDVTITGATLTPQGGGDPVTVISSSDPVTVDFASLMGFDTLLKLASVPTGTYSEINLTLSSPELTVYDTTLTPPGPNKIATTLTSSTVTVKITPALNVATSGSAGLLLDFGLLKSVQTDASGQVTGTVNPVFRVVPINVVTQKILHHVDELRGIVQSVSTTSTNSFAGSFTLVRWRGGPVLTVYVTNETQFEGQNISGLADLQPDTFVEVEASVDGDGNIVAKTVEVHQKVDLSNRRAAFLGIITEVTPDTGPATQFKMVLREFHPNISNIIGQPRTVVVNISNTTWFWVAAFWHPWRMGFWSQFNNKGLRFDQNTLVPGQFVAVHGRYVPNTTVSDALTVNANWVVLRVQPLLGNFDKVLARADDGKTGGFSLIPCGPLLQGKSVNVLTFPHTAFAGFADLNELTTKDTLVVRGLLFGQQTDGSMNGVTWTAPALVDESLGVRKLNTP